MLHFGMVQVLVTEVVWWSCRGGGGILSPVTLLVGVYGIPRRFGDPSKRGSTKGFGGPFG